MSPLNEINCRERLAKEKERAVKTESRKKSNRKLSLTQAFDDGDVESWKACHSNEISNLRDWLKLEGHLPQHLSDRQLLTFLHSCHYSVEQAKAKIDFHCSIRSQAPEIFLNRSIDSKEMVLARKITRISPLRCATAEGYNAIFIDSLEHDVENFNFTEAVKMAGLAIDVLVHCFPRERGNILVFDMQNSVLAHVIKTNLTTLKKSMAYVQKALPFVLKRIHVINGIPLVHQIQRLIKPFIGDDLSNMIHVHMQNNMESFYKFIPQKSLPKDYGGEAETLKELNDKLIQMIQYHEPSLKSLESLTVDESKRKDKSRTTDSFGAEGFFRKLEID